MSAVAASPVKTGTDGHTGRVPPIHMVLLDLDGVIRHFDPAHGTAVLGVAVDAEHFSVTRSVTSR